jgi:hypothetical protein
MLASLHLAILCNLIIDHFGLKMKIRVIFQSVHIKPLKWLHDIFLEGPL